jgi:repressor LexA
LVAIQQGNEVSGLTKRQAAVLAFVDKFIKTNEYSPSFSEIQEHFGFASPTAVAKHIAALERRGFVHHDRYTSRSLTVNHSREAVASEILKLPLIGSIAAGIPIQTHSQIESIALPGSLLAGTEASHLLKIIGSGFHEEMLLDGDYLVVATRVKPYVGETVIVVVNGYNTLIGDYFVEDSYIKLVSRTPHHQPMLLRQTDVVVQGVVIAVFRKYSPRLTISRHT